MSVSPRVHSASLSRAYAALRYLEELKAENIRNPVPMTPSDSEAGDDAVVEAPFGEELASMLRQHKPQPSHSVSPTRSESQTQTVDVEPSSKSISPGYQEGRRGDSAETLQIEEDDQSPAAPSGRGRLPSSTGNSPQRSTSPFGTVVVASRPPSESFMRPTASSRGKEAVTPTSISRPVSRVPSATGRVPSIDVASNSTAPSNLDSLSAISVGINTNASLGSAVPTSKMGHPGRFSSGITPPAMSNAASDTEYTDNRHPTSVLGRMAAGLPPQSPPRTASPSTTTLTTTSLLTKMLDELVHLRHESQRTAQDVEMLKRRGSEASSTNPVTGHIRQAARSPHAEERSPTPPRKIFPKKPFSLTIKDPPAPTSKKAEVVVPPVKTKRLDPNAREPWQDVRPSTLTAQTAASAARKAANANRVAPPAADDRYSYTTARTGVTISGLMYTSPAPSAGGGAAVSDYSTVHSEPRNRSGSRHTASLTSPRGTHGSQLREVSSQARKRAEEAQLAAASAISTPKRQTYTQRVLSQPKRATPPSGSPPRRPVIPHQAPKRGAKQPLTPPTRRGADPDNWDVMPNRHSHTSIPTQSKHLSPMRGAATPRRTAPQPQPLASPIPRNIVTVEETSLVASNVAAALQSPPRRDPTVSPLSTVASPVHPADSLADFLSNFYTFEDRYCLNTALEGFTRYVPSGMADATEGRAWLAVSLAANHPSIVEHVIAPLLVSDLTDSSTFAGNSSRVDQVLCCLIGFGHFARIALQPLLELLGELHPPSGAAKPLYSAVDVKLVVLAVRAVGGVEGLQALSYLASEGVNPAMRAVALYGMGIFLRPTYGHSTVLVMGSAKLKGKMSFLQPSPKQEPSSGLEVSGDEPSSVELPASHSFPLSRMPPYRITHVFLETTSVARYILSWLASSGPMNAGQSVERRTPQEVILRDFLAYAPAVLEKLHPEYGRPNAPSPLSALDVGDLLAEHPNITRGPADVRGGIPTIPHHSLSEMLAADDGGAIPRRVAATVEVVLTGIFEGDDEPLSDDTLLVVEQCLVMCAAQPQVVANWLVAPLMDILVVKGGMSRLEAALNGGATLGVACVALAKVLWAAGVQPSSAVTTLMSQFARSVEWKIRHAACIALGIAGPSSSEGAATAAVAIVLEGLVHSSLGAATACWALKRLGKTGLAELVILIGKREISAAIRVEAVKALGDLDVMLLSRLANADVRLVVDGVAKALLSVVESTIGTDVLEDLTSESVMALGKILAGFVEESPEHDQMWAEGGSYHKQLAPAPLLSLLDHYLDDDTEAVLSHGVLGAIAASIALFGGPHGEVRLIHRALQGRTVPVRVAAAHALQLRGPRTIRALAATLNDPHSAVRDAALVTLEAWGADSVCRVLRTRPPEHRNQIINAIDEHFSLFSEGSPQRAHFLLHLRTALLQEQGGP